MFRIRSAMAVVLLTGSPDTIAADYDVVIMNGQVMDPETMLDATRNVGIRDGVIATITQKRIRGNETINARGHVVTAGFIDTHHHDAGNLWGTKVGLRHGLTLPDVHEASLEPGTARQ